MVERPALIIAEVAPTIEYIPPYLAYVAMHGYNIPELFEIHPKADTDQRELLGLSLMIGRACELASAALDRAADAKLHKARNRLGKFIGGPDRHTLETSRRAMLLDSVAAVVDARHDETEVDLAYQALHARVVSDVTDFRSMYNRVKDHNHGKGRPLHDEITQDYYGDYAERVLLGATTRIRGVFTMPALVHHDMGNDGATNHDEVLIVKQARGSFHPDEVGDTSPFIVQKVQEKSYCIALCPVPQRRQSSESRLRRDREKYSSDIVLASAHCDLPDPEIGLATVATQLQEELAGTILDKELLELNLAGRELAGRLLRPSTRRLGRKELIQADPTALDMLDEEVAAVDLGTERFIFEPSNT